MTIPTDLLARLRAAIADAKDDGHAYAVATRADLAALLALVEAPAPVPTWTVEPYGRDGLLQHTIMRGDVRLTVRSGYDDFQTFAQVTYRTVLVRSSWFGGMPHRVPEAIAEAKAAALGWAREIGAVAEVEAPAPLTVDGCPGCAGALAGLVDTVCGTCRAAAVDAFAPPPESAGERRPVAGWRVVTTSRVGGEPLAWALDIAPRAKVQAWHVMTLEVFALTRGRFTFAISDIDGDSLVKAYPDGGAPFDTIVAAQLAAEDAADALLCAGRRALGRVK